MKNKTVAVISLIAMLLLAFIVFFEKGTMSTDERNERRNHVFVDYRTDAVETFTLRNTAGETVAVTSSESYQGGAKTWAINTPSPLDTEPSEVQSVLSALDYVLKNRTVRGENPTADPKYGLEQPRVHGSFTINGETTSFRIGGDAQDGKVYLAVDGVADEIFVVDSEFFSAMNKTRDDLRLKKILPRPLHNAHEIHVTQPNKSLQLRRQAPAPWQVEIDGTYILADNRQVQELLQTMGDLRAARFVADDLAESELHRYGLSNPAVSVAMHLPNAQTVTVLAGNPCPEQPHHRYITVATTGTVACVKDDFLPVVERSAARLREFRPAVFEDDDIVRITLARGGRTLILEKEDGLWGAAGEEAPELEQGAVEELLRALGETKAHSIAVAKGEIAQLGKSAAGIKLDTIEKQGHIELNFFHDPIKKTVRIRRSEEPAVLTVPNSMLEIIRPDILAFRKRTIAAGDSYDAEKLSIRGPVTQKLEKRAGLWTVVEPIEIAADGDAARRLAALTTEITVVRFVSSKAEKRHGLETPFAEISASLSVESLDSMGHKDQTKSRDIVLQLGARTDNNHRFARLVGEDQTVFVVGPEYEEAIRNPFVARDLMQISETDLVRIAFDRNGAKQLLQKDGLVWTSADQRKIDLELFKRLLSELSAIKTVRAHSFETVAGSFEPTTLIITATVSGDPEKTTVITVGQRTIDPAEDGYYARLHGLPVTFVIPARLVDGLLTLTGK